MGIINYTKYKEKTSGDNKLYKIQGETLTLTRVAFDKEIVTFLTFPQLIYGCHWPSVKVTETGS